LRERRAADGGECRKAIEAMREARKQAAAAERVRRGEIAEARRIAFAAAKEENARRAEVRRECLAQQNLRKEQSLRERQEAHQTAKEQRAALHQARLQASAVARAERIRQRELPTAARQKPKARKTKLGALWRGLRKLRKWLLARRRPAHGNSPVRTSA